MSRSALLLGALLVGCAPVRDGTAAWEDGDPSAAVSAWAEVAGEPSSATHYNLGIAAYRAGDLPLSIAHWRAARRLSPRAGDVVHNLAHARGELRGVSAPVPEPRSWMEFATPTEVALAGILLVLLASLGLVRSTLREEAGSRVYGWLGVLGLSLGITGASAAMSPGVFVLTSDVVVRDAPEVTGRERSSLGAGSEVYVEAAAGPWVRVWDGGARRGWVPADAGLLAGPRSLGMARRVGVGDAVVPASTEPVAPDPTQQD